MSPVKHHILPLLCSFPKTSTQPHLPQQLGEAPSGDVHHAAEQSMPQRIICLGARVGHVCPGSALAMEASAQGHRKLPRKVTQERLP